MKAFMFLAGETVSYALSSDFYFIRGLEPPWQNKERYDEILEFAEQIGGYSL